MAKFREARIMLNPHKPGSTSFFDPISRLHLTKGSPIDIIRNVMPDDKVTPAVLIGLKGAEMFPKLIDIDGRIDLVTGKFKDLPEQVMAPPIEDEEEEIEFTIDGPIRELVPLVEEVPEEEIPLVEEKIEKKNPRGKKKD